MSRDDYMKQCCRNCKFFHFQNIYNSWCDRHNEGISTDDKACLCWQLRKEHP